MAGHLQVSATLLSAAAYLSCAVDDLRAAGLVALADKVDSFIAVLDAKIEVLNANDGAPSSRPPGLRLRAGRRRA